MQGRGYSYLLLRGFFARQGGSTSFGHVPAESLKLISYDGSEYCYPILLKRLEKSLLEGRKQII